MKYGEYRIVLIEHFKTCTTYEEKAAREYYWMKEMRETGIDVVNKICPGRTKKEWQQANRDKNKISDNKYYENNREKCLERNAKPFTCGCGSIFRIGGKSQHSRTYKHQEWAKTNIPLL